MAGSAAAPHNDNPTTSSIMYTSTLHSGDIDNITNANANVKNDRSRNPTQARVDNAARSKTWTITREQQRIDRNRTYISYTSPPDINTSLNDGICQRTWRNNEHPYYQYGEHHVCAKHPYWGKCRCEANPWVTGRDHSLRFGAYVATTRATLRHRFGDKESYS